MYAELAYYGHGYYGLSAASCGYFDRPPDSLTWAQAAMLAGVVNAPSTDDPIDHPNAARRREDHVFDRLMATGALSKADAETQLAAPLGLVGHGAAGEAPSCGRAS
jgi:membrane peptidoglycan carboxypeptidase